MPGTVTELGTLEEVQNATIIVNDPDWTLAPNVTTANWAFVLTLTDDVPAEATVFVALATHSGFVDPQGDGTGPFFVIEDSQGHFYEQGFESWSTGDVPGCVLMYSLGMTGLSAGDTITFRYKCPQTLAPHYGTTNNPMPVCMRAFMVEGITFPDVDTDSTKYSLGVWWLDSASSPHTHQLTHSVPSGGNHLFSIALFAWEPKTGDTYSDNLNGFTQFTPQMTSSGLTKSGDADHYIDVGLRVRYREIFGASGSYFQSFTHTSTQSNIGARSAVLAFVVGDVPVGRISKDYGINGQKLLAEAFDSLTVKRYDTAFPPVVVGTETIETSDSFGVSLICRMQKNGSPIWDLFYAHSDSIKYRTSRDSGRTWSMPSTIASNKQDVSAIVDELRGICVAAVYDEANSKIQITVSSTQSVGQWTSFSTPVDAVTSAKRGFCLKMVKSGLYELSYRNTSDTLVEVYCRKLTKTGTGTWS